MHKKGAVDVDWVLSLGIFLIFLAFFFLYLAPFIQPAEATTEALLDNVERNLFANATWNVQRLPIFVNSSFAGQEIAVLDLQPGNFTFSENQSYHLAGSKIIFSASLHEGMNLFWIVSSPESYPAPANANLSATANDFSEENFYATFEGIAASAQHYEKERISAFNISVDGQKAEFAAAGFNKSGIGASYKANADTINHTAIVADGFSRIVNYANPISEGGHNITIAMILHNYTGYYLSTTDFGSMSGIECKSAFTKYTDLYDSQSGISIVTGKNADVTLCSHNNTVSLVIETILDSQTKYELIFHEGDYNNSLKYADMPDVIIGMAENVTGLSIEKLQQLNASSYANLKSAWSHPAKRNFAFYLDNSTATILSYNPLLPGTVNVYAKEFEEVTVDKYGKSSRRKLRIIGW